MVAPVVLAAIPASATIMAAVLTFMGIMFKNKFIAIIGILVFLYAFRGVLNLPPFIWIAIVVVMFFTIMGGNK